jgi:hypothetical protein
MSRGTLRLALGLLVVLLAVGVVAAPHDKRHAATGWLTGPFGASWLPGPLGPGSVAGPSEGARFTHPVDAGLPAS